MRNETNEKTHSLNKKMKNTYNNTKNLPLPPKLLYTASTFFNIFLNKTFYFYFKQTYKYKLYY